MDIRPILSTLRRHQTAAALIVIEIALTCAILCNALDLIGQRITRLQRSTGWAEAELVVIGITGIGKEANADALTRQDLAALRALPGVRQATIINQVPYGGSSWNTGVQLAPDQQRNTMTVSQYLVSEHFIDTMGLRLIAGRDFLPDEYSYESAANNDSIRSLSVIVSRAMGERLFPKGDVLGKTIYMRDMPAKIVGIVDTLTSTRDLRPDRAEMAMAMPLRVAYSRGGQYVLRTDPAQRNAVLKAAVAELQKINPNRVVLTQRTFEEMKSKFFAPDRAMAGLLAAVCIALLVVTALGIVGLASFWVQQRTRMIGTRRALGATRGQILRYFQTENFVLASAGIVLGMAGAYGINQVLMTQYELARLPAFYLPVGAVALWALGQLAVLAPARRAATLPPVAALRA
jgi:putative ABC transport system permease protein